MKIREVRAVGLIGATPEGGWSTELRPEDSVHTLVAVLTDEGSTGVGSVFTNVGLVRAALAVLTDGEGDRVMRAQMIFSDPRSELLPELDRKGAWGAYDATRNGADREVR